jgi:aldehyde:ferredoxin oxidoreductase
MLYGFAGKFLRVDLTNERVSDDVIDEDTARKYLGGTGMGAKCLFDEVPAGIEWSDPGNRIIFASGPLGGTTVGGSGTVSMVTKGALTNGAGASQANGFFGAFLRHSGYDGIIIQGAAKRWLYLFIYEGGAELRDAAHLLGKDTYETTTALRAELDLTPSKLSIASIGPAGEHLVKFGCVMVDNGHAAAHNGTGAVMGSKRLKAIAVVRGKKKPPLKDKKGFNEIAEQFYSNIINDPKVKAKYHDWGTLMLLPSSTRAKDGIVPVRNYTTCLYDIDPDKLDRFSGPYIRSHFNPKPHPCWACRMHHCHMITIPEGPYAGLMLEEPEYEDLAAWGPLIGNTDVSAAMMLTRETDALGMDSNEAGWLMGMLMECYEKGLISKKDCGDLEMTWGNVETTREMLHRIAFRQGFGDLLAEGVMRAARAIGRDAPNFAIHTMKGNTPNMHDHRNWWTVLFDTCVSQMGTAEGFSVAKPADIGVSDSLVPIPSSSPEDALAMNSSFKGGVQFEDSLGVCRFNTQTDMKLLSEAISAATGWNFSAAEGMSVGRRIVNLLRVFNMRHGHTAEMDAPSPRYGSAPINGPNKEKSILIHWKDLRSKYYEHMGWDTVSGKPLPETLRKLGLDSAISELWGK